MAGVSAGRHGVRKFFVRRGLGQKNRSFCASRRAFFIDTKKRVGIIYGLCVVRSWCQAVFPIGVGFPVLSGETQLE